MIKRFVDNFVQRAPAVRAKLSEGHPDSYQDLVKLVIEQIANGHGDPDPTRIHQIDDGDWQGTLLFVIAAAGYQPDAYWYVKVDYGSCSGCDTLQAISDISAHAADPPTPQQVDDYYKLALHIAQGLKAMQDE